MCHSSGFFDQKTSSGSVRGGGFWLAGEDDVLWLKGSCGDVGGCCSLQMNMQIESSKPKEIFCLGNISFVVFFPIFFGEES